MAIVESLSATECRFRSIVPFELGEVVEFDLVLHGAPKVFVTGKVASRTRKGPRLSCTLVIDAAASGKPELIVVAAETARKQARSRTTDILTGNGLTRSSVRVPVDTSVTFVTEEGDVGHGQATNISVGGMQIVANARLSVGAALDLAFTLPATPDEKAPLRLLVRARIVATQPDGDAQRYNLAFHSVDHAVAQMLDRFVATTS